MVDDPVKLVRAKPKFRFPLQPFGEIVLHRSPSYLVRGLIPREGLVVFWGPPKCGKTFLVFDMAMHIALGWKYRGRRVYAGTVVYVACEGERGLAARVEAFRREKMGDETADPAFFLLTTRLDLAQDFQKLIEDIKAQIGEQACVTVVVDTLNRSLVGSESKDEDMAAYIKGADAIREAFSCAVVIIHHCGHEASRPRGHTSLAGAADAQIAVKKDAADYVIATVELMKDGEAGAIIKSELVTVPLGDDDDGETITSCIIMETDAPVVSTPREKPLTPYQRLVLSTLSEMFDKGIKVGKVQPNGVGSVTFPSVTRDDFREWSRTRGVFNVTESVTFNGPIPDKERQKFSRAINELAEKGKLFILNDDIWLNPDNK